MKKKVLALVALLAVLVLFLVAWVSASGGPVPWVSKFTAERYCALRHLPASAVQCNESDYQFHPELCVNGYRQLCHGLVEDNKCVETADDRFNECMSNLVYFGESKNYCNLIGDEAKKNSCSAR